MKNTKNTDNSITQIDKLLYTYDYTFIQADELLKFKDDTDGLYDFIIDRIREQDIIYYYNAMKYLAENDISLRDSLNIASEYGYTLKGLNSELLATLLHQEKLIEKLDTFITDYQQIVNNTNTRGE